MTVPYNQRGGTSANSPRHYVPTPKDVGGEYAVPLDAAREWQVGIGAASARMAYAPGLEQGRASRSGASVEAEYRPASKMWKTALVYGHGFDAVRGNRHGADSVMLSLEVDLGVLRYHQ